jgi:quercetin dioxygenase-like cupin family protein
MSAFPDTIIKRGNPLPSDFAELGIEVNHFFVGNGYTKLFTIPAGRVIGQHEHNRGHWSALLIGEVTLFIEDESPNRITAPTRVWIEAERGHAVRAETDTLWACIWDNPTGESDPVAFDLEVTRS